MADTPRSLYAVALRNTHAMETQGLRQMESQVKGLEHYPDYERLLREHITVTKAQVQRLESAMIDLGESTSSLKEAVTNTVGKIGAAVHALAQDETLKNLYAGYAYQYEQVAAYRSLIVFAKGAGQTAHTAGFQLAIDEERRAAEAVDRLIEEVTQKYIARTLQGKKADS
ncbi:DUF892 family protein [Antarcticirhabdus aurantiaca]|uniref:DUF892 family protein n=1 Tax=Antarcticirhabdus aurantiaca TaxID=2606717 RepID=A0ACD4NMC5_9HYPH|nr:DUF892 family protein [Antarcticirhabdus aurantiaca]WAJ27878.1 DUF892 family protein [Jeongeuplla avenae]